MAERLHIVSYVRQRVVDLAFDRKGQLSSLLKFIPLIRPLPYFLLLPQVFDESRND